MKVIITRQDQRKTVEIDCLSREAGRFRVAADGAADKEIRVLARNGDCLTLEIDGGIHDFLVFRNGDGWIVEESRGIASSFEVIDERRQAARGAQTIQLEGVVSVKAQMPGKVIRVLKQAGEEVETGEGVVIIESMKMQNELKSPKTGTVRSCGVRDHENVNAGQLLFEIE